MIKKLLKKWRIWILIIILIFSYLSINPQFSVKGIAVKSIELNSSAYNADMRTPSANLQPTQQEIISSLNNNEINTVEEYSRLLSSIPNNSTLRIQTNKAEYVLLKDSDNIGITITNAASSNIRKGLELQGGTRVVLQPEKQISDQERSDLISTMENRLNVYGLSDLKIKPVDDLLGNKYILLEITGASKEEVKDLIASQGKFEAKIGDDLVFSGGKKDIPFVCRNDGTCSGIRPCESSQEGFFCRFEFSISLSPEAAKKHAEVTGRLDVNTTENGRQFLSKALDLYVDGKKVDSLQIAAELKGKEATQIAVSGPGIGKTNDEAFEQAIKNMNKLQTILITGSLPTKLNIVKLDTISPSLGEAFIKNSLLVGLLAILSVVLVVFIRYRKLKVVIPMIITLLSEIFILLGFSALLKYNLDLAAIAGLIVVVGTGVDDQIVILDETLKGAAASYRNWKERLKRAFFIILTAYVVTVAAMVPLLKAGAGLLSGFALVTIVGISIGVFITRPAYAAMLEVLMED